MSDLSALSDDELLRLYNGGGAPAAPAPAAPDLSKMSDADLLKLYGAAPAAPAGGETSLLRKAADAYDSVRSSAPIDSAMNSAGGIVRGVAGMAGMPNAGVRLAEGGLGWLVNKGAHLAGLKTNSDLGLDTSSGIANGLVAPETIEHALDPVLPTPKTTLGKYSKTGGEFVGGLLAAPSTYATKLATRLEMAGLETVPREALKAPTTEKLTRELLPVVGGAAVASETAGQATQGTAAEPWARLGGAVLGGGGAALATGPAYYEKLAADAARRANPEQWDAAMKLKAEKPWLTNAEALQWSTQGQTGLGRVLRLTESIPAGEEAMRGFFAARPQAMQSEVAGALDGLGPRATHLGELGGDIRSAGRGAVQATPQGRALTRALDASGPDTTAGMAGGVIQPDLVGVRTGRENYRDMVGAVDYGAARRSPERIAIDRTVQVERPGEPIVTPQEWPRPQFHDDAPRPLEPFSAGPAAEKAAPEMSLARFVAANGGIDLSGDARAANLDKWVIPGVGKVSKEGGKSIDGFWRTALKEHGYLSRDADGYTTEDITNKLLRELQNEQRDKALALYPNGRRGPRPEDASTAALRDDYENALSVHSGRLNEDLHASGIDPESVHPDIQSRVLGALMRGEHSDPLTAYEHVTGRMRANPPPLVTPTTVTEEISAPRFGQVDPRGAGRAIQEQLRFAKGDVRPALGSAQRDLRENHIDATSGVRELDLSVSGNLKARERLDHAIQAARAIGDDTKAGDLQVTRNALNRALKEVPEVAHADANFAANSVPLEPFRADRLLGRATQTPAGSYPGARPMMPPEQVPPMLSTAEGLRELRANAGPSSQASMHDYLATQAREAAHDPASYGRINAQGLRDHMRRNADVMAEALPVRERLSRLLAAREDLAPVERSALGRVAASDTVDGQLQHLLGKGTRAVETAEATQGLMRQDMRATRQLAREAGGRLADETVNAPTRKALPDELAGARFAAKYLGPGKGDRLRALIREAGGRDVAARLGRVVDGLQATGWRQDRGSLTAFNAEALSKMKSGGKIGEGAKFGANPMKTAHDAVSSYLLAKSAEKSAHLQMSPDGLRRMRELAESPTRAALIALLAAQAAHRR